MNEHMPVNPASSEEKKPLSSDPKLNRMFRFEDNEGVIHSASSEAEMAEMKKRMREDA